MGSSPGLAVGTLRCRVAVRRANVIAGAAGSVAVYGGAPRQPTQEVARRVPIAALLQVLAYQRLHLHRQHVDRQAGEPRLRVPRFLFEVDDTAGAVEHYAAVPASQMDAVRRLHAYVDRRGALPRELQRARHLESEQLVGGGNQKILLTSDSVESELQIAECAEPLFRGAGAVAEQSRGEARRPRIQVAPQGGVMAVVGNDGDRSDGAGALEVVEQVREDGTTADLDQRLRCVGEQCADAGAVARGEQYGIQCPGVDPTPTTGETGAPGLPSTASSRTAPAPGADRDAPSAAATRTGSTVNPSSS